MNKIIESTSIGDRLIPQRMEFERF
jgi:cell division cycle 20-like protein 1, cofactor of APC complex